MPLWVAKKERNTLAKEINEGRTQKVRRAPKLVFALGNFVDLVSLRIGMSEASYEVLWTGDQIQASPRWTVS